MFDGLQARDAAAVAKLSLLYFAILAVRFLLSIAQVFVRYSACKAFEPVAERMGRSSA
jgi:hypothetical protein